MVDTHENSSGRPLIRIGHWFLLTAVCALVASVRVGWTSRLDVLPDHQPFMGVANFFIALVMGAAVTGLVIVVGRRVRGSHPRPAGPGHLLMLYIALGYLLSGAIEIVGAAAQRLPQVALTWTKYDLWNTQMLAMIVGAAMLSFVVAWRLRGNYWWKGVPAAIGVALAIHIPLYCYVLQGNWIPWLDHSTRVAQVILGVVLPLLCVIAIRRDRRRQVERDWLHWLGVGLMVVGAIGGAGEGIYFWNA